MAKDVLKGLIVDYFYLREQIEAMDKDDPQRYSKSKEKDDLYDQIKEIWAQEWSVTVDDPNRAKKINHTKKEIMRQMKFSDLPLTFDPNISKFYRIKDLNVLDYLCDDEQWKFKKGKNIRLFGKDKGEIKIFKGCELVDNSYRCQIESCLSHNLPIYGIEDIMTYQRQEKKEIIIQNLPDILTFLYEWAGSSLQSKERDYYCFHPHTKSSIEKIDKDPNHMIKVLSNCCSGDELNQEPEKVFQKFRIF